MMLPFEKWHGCQNDFIVVKSAADSRSFVEETLVRQASRLCSRAGDGIGACGILVIEHSKTLDRNLPLTIINSDGSIAENCGNGLRCAALSIFAEAKTSRNEALEGVSFIVKNVTYPCRFLKPLDRGLYPYVAVNMPPPVSGSALEWGSSARDAAQDSLQVLGLSHAVSSIDVCAIGNPHLVLFCKAKDGMTKLVEKFPRMFQEKFGAEININFALDRPAEEAHERRLAQLFKGATLEEEWDLITWERGVGVTPSCGSGSCAVAVLGLAQGLIPREHWLGVISKGGTLFIKQAEEKGEVVLVGPGEMVFRGELEL